MKHISPQKDLQTFTCPHCKTVSYHEWANYTYQEDINWGLSHSNRPCIQGGITIKGNCINIERSNLYFSRCITCGQKTIWINDNMVYPTISAPPPNIEMPKSVLDIYKEAELIYSQSPRAACALLRLAIQLLCKELGEKGENINNDIGELVKKGLPTIVQEALDVVRVIGNNAVHPGRIDTEDLQTATQLFELVNIIVEYMIAMPNKTSGLFSNLPTGAKNAITIRDSK